MSIQLSKDELALKDAIKEKLAESERSFQQHGFGESTRNPLIEAGKMAHKLHMSLTDKGVQPRHHSYMEKNRGVPADDPEFYMHVHPIEDLLAFLENQNANEDPKDDTIMAEFEFRVYSNRWGHDDIYKITRTTDGWNIQHKLIGGPCDKGGRPYLFRNLLQDSISYPEDLSGWMEWLWEKAASEGLTKEQVQQALQQLADWVTTVEKHSPQSGVWRGYK